MSPPEESTGTPTEGLWHRFLAASTDVFRGGLARLEGIASLSEREKEKLARRFRETLDSALDVPPDLWEKTRAEVARLPAAERADPVASAWQRTRRVALRTAGVGAATTLPAVVPGIGPAIAALGLVADWRFVAEQQRNLVLQIAALFGVELKNPAEEVRLLFLISSGVSYADSAVGIVLSRELAKRAGQEVARRGLARAAPVAGAAAAGSLNYTATLALGRAAIKRFAREAGIEISATRWAQEHPRFKDAREQILAGLGAASDRSTPPPVLSDEVTAAVPAFSAAERGELLEMAVAHAWRSEDSGEGRQAVGATAAGLGFGDADVEKLWEKLDRTWRARARRIRQLLQVGGSAAGASAAGLWRRSRDLARTGWSRARWRRWRSRANNESTDP